MEPGAARSHAYIVAAPAEPGYADARDLARSILCTGPDRGPRPCGLCENCRKAAQGIHPDIMTIARQTDDKGKPRREIYVDQVRAIAADAPVLPNEAEGKVYIIRDAGTMNAAAQNALLKVLEEPPAFVTFILVTDTPGQLLETVRSRCVTRRRNGADDPPPAEAVERAAAYLALATEGDGAALLRFAGEHETLSTAEMQDFVRAVRLALTDRLCGRAPDGGLPRRQMAALERLMETAAEYLRFNVSTKHVWGVLSVDTLQSGEQV